MSQTALRESREKGEWKSRVGQISLKGRGEEERQCEPVGTWRKRVKRSLLLSTATRRGLAGACLSPPPSPSGVQFRVFHRLPSPSGAQFRVFHRLPSPSGAQFSVFLLTPSPPASRPGSHFNFSIFSLIFSQSLSI